MAEPKKRTNKSKRGMRRMHQKAKNPAMMYCPKCHEPKLKHRACSNCGHYRDGIVLEEKQEA